MERLRGGRQCTAVSIGRKNKNPKDATRSFYYSTFVQCEAQVMVETLEHTTFLWTAGLRSIISLLKRWVLSRCLTDEVQGHFGLRRFGFRGCRIFTLLQWSWFSASCIAFAHCRMDKRCTLSELTQGAHCWIGTRYTLSDGRH